MQVIAQDDQATPPATRKVIDGVLIAVGLVYLGYFAPSVIGDLDGFLTRKNLEDFWYRGSR